jgi:hypothetical protein
VAGQVEELFHLDVKADNLKGFLQNLVSIVNQQSSAINNLQTQLKIKIEKYSVIMIKIFGLF